LDLLPVLVGEVGEGGQFVFGVDQHLLDLGELGAEHGRDRIELGAYVGGVGLSEDGADGGGDHLCCCLRDHPEHVSHEVKPSMNNTLLPVFGLVVVVCEYPMRSVSSWLRGSRWFCRI
jgi:hypothetical protein